MLSQSAHTIIPDALSISTIRVMLPATAGELWQGHLGGRLMLVNCPINYFASLEAIANRPKRETLKDANRVLVDQAVEFVERRLQPKSFVSLRVSRPIPRGLGMASSTTEIAGAAYASARALNASTEEASGLAHEAVNHLDSGNDCNYLPGISLAAPKLGKRILMIESVPDLAVTLVNTGGSLNTLEMDRAKERAVCKARRVDVRRSLLMMLQGLSIKSPKMIGMAATMSTEIYQAITPKPYFSEAKKIAAQLPGVVGLASGHSGTLLCFLSYPDFRSELIYGPLRSLYGEKSVLGTYKIISGGIHES